jgi:hypothetical protein
MLTRSRWWGAGLAVLGLVGCADGVVTGARPAVSPARSVHSAECDPSVPCFDSPDDVPKEWSPRIYDVSPIVYWDGSTAIGSSRMSYYGNRAEEKFTLTITGPSTASRTAESASNGGILPDNYVHSTNGFPLTAPGGSCGHLANLTSQHFATTTIWITYRGFGSTTVSAPGGDSSRQPDCSCGGEGGGGPDDPGVESVTEDGYTPANCTAGGGPGERATRLTCYTVTTDYYWYYPDTGTYEYRYTDESTWCEEDTA